MSVIVIEVLPVGIIFGADRHRTVIDKTGKKQIEVTKVKKSASEKILIGSIGCGEIAGESAQDWLLNFVDKRDGMDFVELCKELKSTVESERKKSDKGKPEAQIINVGTFVKERDNIIPSVRYISNCWSLVDGNYTDVREQFGDYPDVFRINLNNVAPEVVRPVLEALAKNYSPLWFHHSIGLKDFNILEAFTKQALKTIANQQKREAPKALEEWERYVRMSVLVYGAFFEAFRGADEQYVGGGADIVSVPWPDKLS